MSLPGPKVNTMNIRKAKLTDLPAIGALYEDARAALKAAGIDQWQDGYPDETDARLDIERGVGYVLEENGEVLATACLAFGREPTYEVMEEGAWSCDPPEYGFLHRIAVSSKAKGKGAAGLMFDELKRQAKLRDIRVLRGDTHQRNLAMQRVLEKSGFVSKGVIRVEDGTPRLAFEWIAP